MSLPTLPICRLNLQEPFIIASRAIKVRETTKSIAASLIELAKDRRWVFLVRKFGCTVINKELRTTKRAQVLFCEIGNGSNSTARLRV
jgi:hypothetical protein